MDSTQPRRLPSLLTGLLFLYGLGCLAATSPFQVPDGGAHFFRAFQIARGQLVGEKRGHDSGGVLPDAPGVDLAHFYDLGVHTNLRLTRETFRERASFSPYLTPGELHHNTSFVAFSNTVRYSPVPYVPQASAIALCELLRLRDLDAYYLAGLFSLLASTLCLYLSFRALDFSYRATRLAFVIAGLPMSMFLIGSIAADGPTISLCILNVALALRLRREFSERIFRALLVCTLLVSTARGLYFMVSVSVLPLSFSARSLRSKPERARLAMVLGCALLPMLFWAYLTRNIHSIMNPTPGIDPALQSRYVLHHFPAVVAMFATQLAAQLKNIAPSFIGMLGWLDTHLPASLINTGYLLLLGTATVSSVDDRGHDRLPASFAAWTWLVFLAFVLAVCLFSYLTWVPVGAGYLEGIEGRYFIPFALPLLIALPPLVRLPRIGRHVFDGAVLAAWGTLSISTVVIIANRYWAL